VDLTGNLSLVGSVASIVGLFLQAPNWRTRVIHAMYGGLTAFLAGCAIYYMTEAARLRQVEDQARNILGQIDSNVVRDSGICLGQALTDLAFLEKNKARFPDTYGTAKKMADNSGVTAPTPKGFADSMDQSTALCRCADALNNFVRGIAGGAAT
jgi:hypothetical protein